jgi:DNA-binding transcriptional MocR family regulator
MRDPAVKKLLTSATKAYATRRQGLMKALKRRSIPSFGRSGSNVWIPVDREVEVCQGLLAKGWAVRPGEGFRLETPPAIRVTISTLEPAEAERLADDLASLIRPEGAAAFA